MLNLDYAPEGVMPAFLNLSSIEFPSRPEPPIPSRFNENFGLDPAVYVS
jgi:hypothetical protein